MQCRLMSTAGRVASVLRRQKNGAIRMTKGMVYGVLMRPVSGREEK